MGFEVSYFYHERKDDGSYDTENKKELKKKVGSGFDDTPLEKLAAAVLSQLARRDIWVVDVKISEFVKKEVNFKESKDGRGIVLKNKKFSFDGTAQIIADEIQEAEPEVAAAMNTVRSTAIAPIPQLQPVPVKLQGGNLAPPIVNQGRVLFKAIYEPEGRNRAEAEREGFRLTLGKKYPVHRQFENPMGGQFGSIFTVTDDTGKPFDVDEKYFTVAGAGLIGGEEFNRDFQREKQPKLLYEDQMRAAPQQQVRSGRVDRSQIPEEYRNIPVEGEEMVDDSVLQMPNLRPNYKP